MNAADKKNILVVEDEAQISRFLQLELEHEGYACSVCADGRAALDARSRKISI